MYGFVFDKSMKKVPAIGELGGESMIDPDGWSVIGECFHMDASIYMWGCISIYM